MPVLDQAEISFGTIKTKFLVSHAAHMITLALANVNVG